MARFSKSDIEFHGGHVAINAKAYHFAGSLDIYKLSEKYGCSEEKAQEAMNWAWESQCEVFWEDAQEMGIILGNIFGAVKIYSEGRSGGWLVPSMKYGHAFMADREDVEHWDAIKVSTWGRYVRAIKQLMDWLCSEDEVAELIDMNDWCKPELMEVE